MTTLTPIEDNILIEPVTHDATTASGIVLTDSNKEKPGKGTVIAVGAGKILDNGQRSPMDITVGDIVYFTKYSPDEIEV
jgi:chaperonin GroES